MVMPDSDLAELYGVETRVLNQAVTRNAGRFPPDFAFQLDVAEVTNLRSQLVISSLHGGSRYAPAHSRSKAWEPSFGSLAAICMVPGVTRCLRRGPAVRRLASSRLAHELSR